MGVFLMILTAPFALILRGTKEAFETAWAWTDFGLGMVGDLIRAVIHQLGSLFNG